MVLAERDIIDGQRLAGDFPALIIALCRGFF
jgi:hypothetical protein